MHEAASLSFSFSSVSVVLNHVPSVLIWKAVVVEAGHLDIMGGAGKTYLLYMS